MKKAFILLLLIGCGPSKYKKPFIVIDKSIHSDHSDYIYQDSTGKQISFESSKDYEPGDTLK